MKLINIDNTIALTIGEQNLLGFIVKTIKENSFDFYLCLDNQGCLEKIYQTGLLAKDIETASWATERLMPIIYEIWLSEKKPPGQRYFFISYN